MSVHPYEEPAFDLYLLQNDWTQAGSGIVGELEEPETELEFLKRIKKTFEVGCLRHNKLTGREIRKVALCGVQEHSCSHRPSGRELMFLLQVKLSIMIILATKEIS